MAHQRLWRNMPKIAVWNLMIKRVTRQHLPQQQHLTKRRLLPTRVNRRNLLLATVTRRKKIRKRRNRVESQRAMRFLSMESKRRRKVQRKVRKIRSIRSHREINRSQSTGTRETRTATRARNPRSLRRTRSQRAQRRMCGTMMILTVAMKISSDSNN